MKLASLTTKSFLASAVVALIAAPSLFAASMTTVTPTSTQGWYDVQSADGGTVTYINGDAPNGFGSGSLRLMTDERATSKANYMRDVRADNMQLSDITQASYWTKQVNSSFVDGTASFQLAVWLEGASGFTTLVYEPYQQNGEATDVAQVTQGEWQKWDVASGQFWSTQPYTNSTPGGLNLVAGDGGTEFYTLEQINAAYPNAVVLGYGVNVGTNNPSYNILVDGVSVNDMTFNFGTMSPKKAMKEECKNNGWRSMSPAESLTNFKNQGECVSYAAKR